MDSIEFESDRTGNPNKGDQSIKRWSELVAALGTSVACRNYGHRLRRNQTSGFRESGHQVEILHGHS